jgi:hypothetical protein
MITVIIIIIIIIIIILIKSDNSLDVRKKNICIYKDTKYCHV